MIKYCIVEKVPLLCLISQGNKQVFKTEYQRVHFSQKNDLFYLGKIQIWWREESKFSGHLFTPGHWPGSTMRKFIGFQFILSQLELKELKDQDIFLGAMFYYRKFLFNLLFGHKFALLAFGCTCFNLLSSELHKTFMKSHFNLLPPKPKSPPC